jgi:hypothetical protein
VPLTPQLLALLGMRQADDVQLFKVSSANAMLNTLKALDGNGFTVHGFRSSFEDWGAEATVSRAISSSSAPLTTRAPRPIRLTSGRTCWRSAGKSCRGGPISSSATL